MDYFNIGLLLAKLENNELLAKQQQKVNVSEEPFVNPEQIKKETPAEKLIRNMQFQELSPADLKMNCLKSIDRAAYIKEVLNLPKTLPELFFYLKNPENAKIQNELLLKSQLSDDKMQKNTSLSNTLMNLPETVVKDPVMQQLIQQLVKEENPNQNQNLEAEQNQQNTQNNNENNENKNNAQEQNLNNSSAVTQRNNPQDISFKNTVQNTANQNAANQGTNHQNNQQVSEENWITSQQTQLQNKSEQTGLPQNPVQVQPQQSEKPNQSVLQHNNNVQQNNPNTVENSQQTASQQTTQQSLSQSQQQQPVQNNEGLVRQQPQINTPQQNVQAQNTVSPQNNPQPVPQNQPQQIVNSENLLQSNTQQIQNPVQQNLPQQNSVQTQTQQVTESQNQNVQSANNNVQPQTSVPQSQVQPQPQMTQAQTQIVQQQPQINPQPQAQPQISDVQIQVNQQPQTQVTEQSQQVQPQATVQQSQGQSQQQTPQVQIVQQQPQGNPLPQAQVNPQPQPQVAEQPPQSLQQMPQIQPQPMVQPPQGQMPQHMPRPQGQIPLPQLQINPQPQTQISQNFPPQPQTVNNQIMPNNNPVIHPHNNPQPAGNMPVFNGNFNPQNPLNQFNLLPSNYQQMMNNFPDKPIIEYDISMPRTIPADAGKPTGMAAPITDSTMKDIQQFILNNMNMNAQQVTAVNAANSIENKDAMELFLSGLINIHDVGNLLKTNGKHAASAIVLAMAAASKKGLDTSQLQDTLKFINASVSTAAQETPAQTLKSLMMLYLPWLPLNSGVGFDLEIETSPGDDNKTLSVLTVLIQTLNYGNLKGLFSLTTSNSVNIHIICSDKFPKDELMEKLNAETKIYSMQSNIEFEEQKPLKDEEKENREAKVNLSATDELNPYLLLMAHSFIRNTILLDNMAGLNTKKTAD